MGWLCVCVHCCVHCRVSIVDCNMARLTNLSQRWCDHTRPSSFSTSNWRLRLRIPCHRQPDLCGWHHCGRHDLLLRSWNFCFSASHVRDEKPKGIFQGCKCMHGTCYSRIPLVQSCGLQILRKMGCISLTRQRGTNGQEGRVRHRSDRPLRKWCTLCPR